MGKQNCYFCNKNIFNKNIFVKYEIYFSQWREFYDSCDGLIIDKINNYSCFECGKMYYKLQNKNICKFLNKRMTNGKVIK